MNKNILSVKNWLLLCAGLLCESLGVVLSIRAGLGVSPISSVPYVLSIAFEHISIGSWTFIFNGVFIVVQVALLRSRFKKIYWLQLPILVIFSIFIDILDRATAFVHPATYVQSLMLIVTGTCLLAFGITLCCIADICLNVGEAMVGVLASISGKRFGKVKIVFDGTLVIGTIVLSFVFFNGLQGVREGTIIMAVCTGLLVHVFTAVFERYQKAE